MTLIKKTAAALIMASTFTYPCVAQAPGSPPERVDFTVTLPASPENCKDFPVQIHVTGKSKTFNLPGNRLIITAPGQNAMLTNVNQPSKQVSLNITGVFQSFNQPDGGVLTIGTGRNLVTDPAFGLTLVTGRFSFAFDSSGNLVQGLTLQAGQTTSIGSLID